MKKKIYMEQRKRLTALLREMRIEAGLTQTELASRVEKDQTFVSKFESGERRLDIIEIREICSVLGLTFEEFARKLDKVLK